MLRDKFRVFVSRVSPPLASGSSSANWNVTDSVTHGVSGNNFSSTSNVSSAQTIGGIVSKETVCCVGGKVKH